MSGHLLLTSWAFPPARTSGVYRAVGIANAFAAAGWRVTVLCGPAHLFRDNLVVDESLVGSIHPAVRIVEVPLEHHELSTDIARWSRLRARQPEIWAKTRLRKDASHFPEPWFGSWAPALRRAAERVHRADAVTLALGTAAPYVDFVPGTHLRERFGVPYVLDYRDAWTFLTFTGEDPPTATPAMRERESALMADALQVWFVNDPIRTWHARRYPDAASRMRTVRNGFDAPGSDEDARIGVPWSSPANRGLAFGYVGTINFGAFPLEAVVEGWKRARAGLPPGSRLVLRGHLGRTGEGSPALLDALASAVPAGVTFEGPVARAEVWDVYRGFDALVLALPSGPGVTSGKVYEYAATGLPIVSVHTPETPVWEVLGDSSHWHPPESLDPQSVAAAFLAAAGDVLSGSAADRVDAIAAGARWERESLLRPAVREIEDVLAGAAS